VVFNEYSASPGMADFAATLVAPILPNSNTAISETIPRTFIRIDLFCEFIFFSFDPLNW
jgi:hypothetical protein